MRYLLLCILLGIATLNAKHFSFDDIHLMPTSIEKDYYIWRYLRQRDTTPAQARRIIKEVSRLNTKLKNAYYRKTGTYPYIKPKTLYYYKTIDKEKRRNRNQADYAFRKALRLLQRGQSSVAISYLKQAERLCGQGEKRDKILFWLYLATKQKRYLHTMLTPNSHVNLYTLLAADITKTKYPDTIVVPSSRRKVHPTIDPSDPIDWARLKYRLFSPTANLEQLARYCDSEETIGMHCYIKERALHHRLSFFPLPYRDTMKRFPVERQALIYAIARQESRFIPGAVSRAFALGLMQIMPFLIDHLAKQRGEHIDYDDIFDPKTAIIYANDHLDYLTSYLYHPLFVAYAYNGGIGFTKKIITRKTLFRKGNYEPYMSLERIPNYETRDYGKKVLVNYVIYLNLLGKPTRLLPFIEDLIDPYMTDRFRKY